MGYIIIFSIGLLLSSNFEVLSDKYFNIPNNNFLDQKDTNFILDNTINPNDYIVGPGDQFYINMLSNNLKINEYLVVSPLGDLILPGIGTINIDKSTLKKAVELIEVNYNKKFENIQFSITLSAIRQFKVKVMGLIDGPYYIPTNPTERVSDIYKKIIQIQSEKEKNFINDENFTNYKISSRNISLHRKDNIENIDILSINMSRNTYNPYLLEEDIISFTKYEQTISIYGGIMYPGTYEFKVGENLHDLIGITGGFTFDGDSNNVEISRYFNINKENVFKIEEVNKLKNFILEPFDFININRLKEYRDRNLVSILGEVNNPGKYILDDSMNFQQLLLKTGGFTKYADSSKILVKNYSLASIIDFETEYIKLLPPGKRTNSEKEYLKSKNIINFGNIVKDNLNTQVNDIFNYKLKPDDEIHISKYFNYVELIGSFKNPGRYPFVKGMSIKEYIQVAGGKNKKSTNKIYIIDINNNKVRIKSKNKILQNGDKLFIEAKQPVNIWKTSKETMAILAKAATLIAMIKNIQD